MKVIDSKVYKFCEIRQFFMMNFFIKSIDLFYIKRCRLNIYRFSQKQQIVQRT